ncbi:MAG TPA: ATP-binding protein, partial [Acetobacteraceae bacterium]|nr:ATP-binding protein [Acetobacteraceae bacterium]
MPLDAAGFAVLLDPLGPFEPRSRLAVAVSGGADSLALALLADAWARGRGGEVRALIVDLGLRPGAAAEAALTRTRLATRGIGARVLTLTGL